jgi:hypothetical protein
LYGERVQEAKYCVPLKAKSRLTRSRLTRFDCTYFSLGSALSCLRGLLATWWSELLAPSPALSYLSGLLANWWRSILFAVKKKTNPCQHRDAPIFKRSAPASLEACGVQDVGLSVMESSKRWKGFRFGLPEGTSGRSRLQRWLVLQVSATTTTAFIKFLRQRSERKAELWSRHRSGCISAAALNSS